MATFDDSPRLKCRPHTPHDRALYATAVLAPRSTRSPKGFPRPRTSRFNVARLPAAPTRPSRGPWLAIGFCCPGGSSLTTASSAPLDSSPPLMDSRRRLLHPRNSAWGGNPEVPQFTPLDCARVPPPLPRWPRRVRMTIASPSVLAFTYDGQVRRPHWTFRGCRVHSELKFVLLLRPASWLALLSRTFTFELAPTRVTLNQRRI